MTREPICHTNECAQDPQAPRVSTQRGETWKVVVKVKYLLILADLAEFASWLARLEKVDTSDGARVSEQVKSQSSDKPCLPGIKDMPSDLLPSSRHTLTGFKTAGTPPDTRAQRTVSLTAECHGIRPPLRLQDKP